MASRFIINNELTFTSDDIDVGSITLEKATDLVGEELSADELRFRVFYDDSSSTLRNEKYAVPVVYYEGDTIVGTFYLTNVTRLASKKYQIDATSMVGILSSKMHYGGMYNNVPFRMMFEELYLSDGLYSDSYKWAMCTYMITNKAQTISNGNAYVPTVRSRVRITFIYYGGTAKIIQEEIFGDNAAGTSKYHAYFFNSDNYTKKRLYIRIAGVSHYTSKYSNETWIGKQITLDIDPANATAKLWVEGLWNGGAYTWNLSDVQATTDYTNNTQVWDLKNIGGADPSHTAVASAIQKITYYTIYNGSTQIFETWGGYIDVRDNTMYWVEHVSGTRYAANNYIDYDFQIIPTTTDNALITCNQTQHDMLKSITYLDGVDSITVSGWLPVGTKRELLYQLLFALNLNMRSNGSGDLIIGGLSNSSVFTIPDDEIYMSGTEKPVEKTRSILLTEHVYTNTTNAVNTFDNRNKAALTDAIVQFESAPVVRNSVASSGLTLKAWNCNAALVSGIGYTTGYVVDHSRVVHEYVVSAGLDGRDVTVSGATLVTYLNVNNVMDRLKAFYNNTVTRIDNSIVYNGEQCGNKYSFKSPFGENISAFLSKISASVSTFAKLMCIFYKNYVPPKVGTSYQNYVLLTGSGTWTVPTGVTKFKAVIIGGGNGGDSGYAGEDGDAMTYMSTVYAAEGGNYGENGTGGNIYEVEVTTPAASYSYSCGSGGNGGAMCSSHTTNNAGTAGGNTTFGSYSSSSGLPYPNGHQNLLNGLIYGGMLPSWNASSGKGGNGGWVEVTNNGNTYHDGSPAYNFRTGVTYSGGATSSDYVHGRLGGGGGGASAFKNGDSAMAFTDWGGAGANGADGGNIYAQTTNPLQVNASYYGYGGIGGIGGGGGGYMGYPGSDSTYVGKGGKGGRGMDGAVGCVIVYY